ncbi:helix-turn-helix domain-containing protein [Haloferax profundi]|uniref:DNA-binding protein n=1 Tax=Haloferax profundi TaxID=1544718 RepID=A0A0W1SW20_9EURY|nr:helix-turn-helix domain-containing protein [Haloferax profundi]KTG30681.1 DNA-binding protein [Haloferax profundi]
MESLMVDMVQYDCPYIDTTVDHDVSFTGLHWDYNTARQQFESRVLVKGESVDALDEGLSALREHHNHTDYRLLSRRGDQAIIKNAVGQTSAMRAIRENGGYLTGAFEASDGSERWHIGFDRNEVVGDALSELDRHNDFTVESQATISFEDYFDVINNVDTAKSVLDAVRGLTDTERRTIQRAMGAGHYETPRGATVTDLAAEFDVSTTAVSKNIRRGERKLLTALVDAMDDVER